MKQRHIGKGGHMPKMSRVLKVLAPAIVIIGGLVSSWGLSVTPIVPQTHEQVQLRQAMEVTQEAQAEWSKFKNEIEKQLARLREFTTKVASAPKSRELLEEASRVISEAAQVFERLASQKEAVKASLLEKIKRLEAIPSDLDARIAALQQQKAQLDGKLQVLSASKADADTIRMRSAQSLIHDLEMEIRVLTIFRNTHGQILSIIKAAISQIDLLAVAIEETAIVFRSKKDAIATIINVADAASLVKDVPEVASLAQEIQTMWDDLDKMMNELANTASEILSAATKTK